MAAKFIQAELALKEAKLGNPSWLITRVLAGDRLIDGEILFIRDALLATAGKRYKKNRRAGKQWAIAEQVWALTDGGTKQEAAISAAMRQHGVKRRTVFAALRFCKNDRFI